MATSIRTAGSSKTVSRMCGDHLRRLADGAVLAAVSRMCGDHLSAQVVAKAHGHHVPRLPGLPLSRKVVETLSPACGHQPCTIVAIGRPQPCFPHRRGLPPRTFVSLRSACLFPAYAGITRNMNSALRADRWLHRKPTWVCGHAALHVRVARHNVNSVARALPRLDRPYFL